MGWWKVSGSKDKYLDAKWKAQHGAYTAKRNAENEKFASVKDNKKRSFMLPNKCIQNQDVIRDVIGQKYIQGDDGNLSLDGTSKKLAWRQHYERLLNIEFLWSRNLPHVDPAAGPAQFIIPDDNLKSLKCMKNAKATGPSDVVTQMLKAVPDICCELIADLMNTIILEGRVPADCSDSIIVSLFKGKVDGLDRSNYCGLKSTDHVLKIIERVVENIICETVNIDEMQFGFCPDQGTRDAILILDCFKITILQNTGNCR